MRNVVVTGMGCISALGDDANAAWRNIDDPDHGIADAEIAALGSPDRIYKGLAARVRANPVEALTAQFPRKLLSSVDRFAQLAAVATAEALAEAGVVKGDAPLDEAAILYGSASGGNATIEAGYHRVFGEGQSTVHPLTVPRLMGSSPASHLSMLFGVHGMCLSISSACASSAHSITEGMHLIRSGRAKMVIVGGSDASLTYGSLISWRSLQAISEDGCRPFSLGRSGTVIGEGAATLILEDEEAARARGGRALARILGSGESSDAGHLTQPDAGYAARAILRAHHDAGIPIEEPLLISAHGTGTLLNDRAEAEALRSVYGASLANKVVIATKAAHGHMLGATGAMELILTILALRARRAPGIRGYLAPDPDCGDLPLALQPQALVADTAISTSLAFGGLNSATIVRAA